MSICTLQTSEVDGIKNARRMQFFGVEMILMQGALGFESTRGYFENFLEFFEKNSKLKNISGFRI